MSSFPILYRPVWPSREHVEWRDEAWVRDVSSVCVLSCRSEKRENRWRKRQSVILNNAKTQHATWVLFAQKMQAAVSNFERSYESLSFLIGRERIIFRYVSGSCLQPFAMATIVNISTSSKKIFTFCINTEWRICMPCTCEGKKSETGWDPPPPEEQKRPIIEWRICVPCTWDWLWNWTRKDRCDRCTSSEEIKDQRSIRGGKHDMKDQRSSRMHIDRWVERSKIKPGAHSGRKSAESSTDPLRPLSRGRCPFRYGIVRCRNWEGYGIGNWLGDYGSLCFILRIEKWLYFWSRKEFVSFIVGTERDTVNEIDIFELWQLLSDSYAYGQKWGWR